MKRIQLAAIAALSTTILAGGTSAFADEVRSVQTENEVSFIAGEGEETEVQPPGGPDGPEVEIEIPPGNSGPLTIAYAPRMINFGQNSISTKDSFYSMIAEEQRLADGSGEMVPYVSFAQIQDTRGTREGWELSLSLTDFVSDNNSVLTGAEIEFVDPSISYGGIDQSQAPEAITNEGNSLFLRPGDNSLKVMQANVGQGAGTSSIVWGDQASLDAQVDDSDEIVKNEAIRLHIPGSTTQDATTYEAKMTWTLSSTVDESGETQPEED